MLRTATLLVFCLAASGFAQTPAVTVTSAASNNPNLTAESLATATGEGLAPRTDFATSLPWPTSLAGVTVDIMDSGSVLRSAGLLFVSHNQVNFQIPPGTALGNAGVFIHNGNTTFSTIVAIVPVAPALFSLGSSGIAAAVAVRTTIPTNIQSVVPVFQCLDTPASCHLIPINVGVDSPVFVSFFGTGIRGRASLGNVVVKIGGVSAGAMYAGPQGQFPGLDQVNVQLPLALHGAGMVDVTVTADGVTSNVVRIHVE